MSPGEEADAIVMKLSCLPAWAGVLLFALCAPAAAQVYKCRGADGKMGFSDQPCPHEQKQETIKAAPPPGSVNLELVCSPAQLRSESGYMRQSVCASMRRCEASGRDHDCQIYCDAAANDYLPEVKFGPAAAACLKHTGRVRGANWVQTSRRSNDAGAFDYLQAACLDKSGRQVDLPKGVVCERGSDRCTTEFGRRARGQSAAAALPGAASLDVVMTRACGG
jgi:hypothetical protein